jgi:Alpha/beta hydrolase domain
MRKLTIGFVLLACGAWAEAKVIKVVIEKRESPAYNGQVFGKAGQYELLSGRFTGELNPNDPHNKIINDIQLAVRNSRGMVEYTGTFAIAKPIDMSKASGLMIYSVANRGNGAPVPGNEGHVSVVSGWQGDVQARAGVQTIVVPIAKNADGSPVTGPVTALFINSPNGANTLPLARAVSAIVYQLPATLDNSKAALTKRASEDGPRTPISSAEWAFADCSKTPFPGTPDATKICVKDSFDPALLYELVYTAKDPLVLGIGYAATRDFNSFLRYEDKDAEGNANPVVSQAAKQIKYGISEGNSQSGNFLRSYIHLGFNQDENNRIVWDGSNPHIAGRQLAMNYRFAVAGGIANLYEPGSDGVLWWSDYPDAARHRATAGMLDRCKASNTCPKIIETFGGLEFWNLRMSPNLVGTDAKEDIPLPANVRRYYFPSTTHGGGRGGFSVAAPAVPNGCVLPANPNPEAETLRALRSALIDWVMKGVEPPASSYPKLHPKTAADGQLVAATRVAMGFPSIPGAPSPDGVVNSLLDYDWGPDFNYNDLSGVIAKAPPAIRKVLPTLVPKTDADGNDLGGVPSVLRQVPLGTYVGWNVTSAGFNQGKICGLNGGYIPFARTKAERVAANDPRLSLEERYGTHDQYVAMVKAVAAKAVADRFLFQEDADKLVAQAAASDVLVAK